MIQLSHCEHLSQRNKITLGVVWGVFQHSERNKRSKNKEERERYAQPNAEFKKAFFNEWCKEIVENNRRWKISDLFKKTENIKETCQPKMGTIKDRNDKDLKEAEEIKKR